MFRLIPAARAVGLTIMVPIAAMMLTSPPTLGQNTWRQPLAEDWNERPPPPTEPSIVETGKASTTTPSASAKAPQPISRPRRPGKGPTGPVALPPPEVQVMLLRGAIAAVHHANFTENYSVIHSLLTPTLQNRANPTQLSRLLANLRKQNVDLSPALVLTPQFTESPSISPNADLRLAGFFPSRPLQINFVIVWRPIDNFWLIDSLSVGTTPAETSVAAQRPPGRAGAPIPLTDTTVPQPPTTGAHAKK